MMRQEHMWNCKGKYRTSYVGYKAEKYGGVAREERGTYRHINSGLTLGEACKFGLVRSSSSRVKRWRRSALALHAV